MADHRDKHGQGGPPGEDGFSLDEILAEFATPRHRSKTAKKLVERTLPDNILLFPGGREVDEGPDLITPPRPAPKAPAAPLSKAPPPADPEEEPEVGEQTARERPAPAREKAPRPLPRQPEAREETADEEAHQAPPPSKGEVRPLRPQGKAPLFRPKKKKSPPPPPQEEPDQPPPEEPEEDAGEGVVIPMPRRGFLGDLRRLFQEANDYADQMYDQAEPTPEDLEAERYIPGVDEEEPPPPPKKRRVKKVRPAPPPPPDVEPAELSERYRKALGAKRLRAFLAFVVTLATLYASLSLPLPPLVEPLSIRVYVLAGGLALVMGLCFDVLGRGLGGLVKLRPNAETLSALAALFTLADALTMPVLGMRDGTAPCCGVAALVLVFSLWGNYHKTAGLRLTCRTAASAKEPYLVTCDGGKWSGRPAYAKWSGTLAGLGSQIQTDDFAQRLQRFTVPLTLLAGTGFALWASLGRGEPRLILWCCSALFTAASSLSALLCFGLPFHGLARRLSKVGAALGGWPGIDSCRSGGILLSDCDLFPPGTVELNGIKVYSDKAVAYAATLLRDAHCGLERPFYDLLRSQGGLYRRSADLRCHEGGYSAMIRNHEVYVGTAAFMHLMEVDMPQGINVKSAVFCAIDGRLAGVFALHYRLHPLVMPSLTALMRNQVRPVLCTRDPGLIPSFLEQKFKLPVDRMEFPSADRRQELSDPGQDHAAVTAAVLCREGLGPFSDAVVGAKRLRLAVRWSALLSALGSAVGLGLAAYLTRVGAFSALTPANLLIFLCAWLLPTLLLSNWVRQY